MVSLVRPESDLVSLEVVRVCDILVDRENRSCEAIAADFITSAFVSFYASHAAFASHGVIHGPWQAPFFPPPPFLGLWRSHMVLKFAHLCPLCDDVDLVKIQPADLKIYEEMRHVAYNRKCVTSLITTTTGFFFFFGGGDSQPRLMWDFAFTSWRHHVASNKNNNRLFFFFFFFFYDFLKISKSRC